MWQIEVVLMCELISQQMIISKLPTTNCTLIKYCERYLIGILGESLNESTNSLVKIVEG